jgi:hypothetical protein
MKELDRIRGELVAKMKSDGAYQALLEELRPDEVRLRLSLLTEAEGKKYLQQLIAPVAALEPERAREILGDILRRQIADDLGLVPPDVAEQRIKKFIEDEIDRRVKLEPHDKDLQKLARDLASTAKKPGDIHKRLAPFIQKRLLSDSARELSELERKALADGEPHSRALLFIAESDKNGTVTNLATALGLVTVGIDLSKGRAFDTEDHALRTSGTLAKAIASTDSVMKGWSYYVTGEKIGATAAKTGKVLKVLGPVGDSLALYADSVTLKNDLDRGKVGLALADMGLVAAGATSVVTGTMIALYGSAACPVAAPLFLLATAVYISATLIKASLSESEETELLSEHGLLLQGKKKDAQAETLRIQEKSGAIQRQLGAEERKGEPSRADSVRKLQ